MTLDQIKQAVAQGKVVHWISEEYEVVQCTTGQWLIMHVTGRCIGLTWNHDGVTLYGKGHQFYTAE